MICAALLVASAPCPYGSRAFGQNKVAPMPGGYTVPLAVARGVVAACALAASGCDPAALPVDAQVKAADGHSFQASWMWLREAVGKAKGSTAAERTESMGQARGHLDEMAAEAGDDGASSSAAEFERARPAATSILARGEFQADAGPTWLDRQIARLQDWFLRVLLGIDRVGTHNPWIAPAVEWTCFLLAAGGLLFFVRRSLARQALRIALGEVTAGAQFSRRDTTDWARLAEERGAAGDWRAGVHCLYWAAILSLESRRAWRPNPTRTPREYVRLLPPGSAAQAALRELTKLFEQVWYGDGTATEAVFSAAQASSEAIRMADLQRNGSEAPRADAGTAAMGAA